MLTDGLTEKRTPISHPATSRCDNEYLRGKMGKPFNLAVTGMAYDITAHRNVIYVVNNHWNPLILTNDAIVTEVLSIFEHKNI